MVCVCELTFWLVFVFVMQQTRTQSVASRRSWQSPSGGLVCLHFFICSLDDDDLCVCDEEACGVGGKYGSLTVALMSHDCLDETLCVADVIQNRSHVFFMPPWIRHEYEDDQMFSCASWMTVWTSFKGDFKVDTLFMENIMLGFCFKFPFFSKS